MTRGKVKLAYITNDAARKASFRKRKNGLTKKAGQLSTLCGVETCVIIYNPNDHQPVVWPNTLEAQRLVSKFRSMPETARTRKMVNQEGFIREMIAKKNEQLRKQLWKNQQMEIREVMYQCLNAEKEAQDFMVKNLMVPDLKDLKWAVDLELQEINRCLEVLDMKESPNQQVAVPPAAVAASGGESKGKAVVQVEEQKLVVDYGDLYANTVQGEHTFSDWMSTNPDDEQMMKRFGDGGPDPMWSSAFFRFWGR